MELSIQYLNRIFHLQPAAAVDRLTGGTAPQLLPKLIE
jgi:hypothetical protein